MSDDQHPAPHADETLLEQSQAAIDEAKRYTDQHVEQTEDDELVDQGFPVAGDSEPADGPAPAA